MSVAVKAYLEFEQTQRWEYERAGSSDRSRIAQLNANMAREFWADIRTARPFVMARNNGQCLRPGCHRDSTECHHVIFRSKYRGIYRHHPANLVPLCKSCHRDLHGQRLKRFDAALKNLTNETMPPWWQDETNVVVIPPKATSNKDCLVCAKRVRNKKTARNGVCGECIKNGRAKSEVNP